MAEGANMERNTNKEPRSEEQESARRFNGVDRGVITEGSAEAEQLKDPLRAEVESLRESLQEEKAKAEDYLKNWQRSQADFINYKRRMEQERVEQTKFANATLILKILPVLDDFERASASLSREVESPAWLEGINLIERKLRFILEQEGVTPIEALGKDFDPQLHEAVMFEEGTDPQHGVVVAELQKGYKLHDRVIRPAMVKVGQPASVVDASEAEAGRADEDARKAEASTEKANGSKRGAADTDGRK
jgi:molecular chaperone GrpE